MVVSQRALRFCCSGSFRLRLGSHGKIFDSEGHPAHPDGVASLSESFDVVVNLKNSAMSRLLSWPRDGPPLYHIQDQNVYITYISSLFLLSHK